MARETDKKTGDSLVLPIPAAWRSTYTAASVCFDLTFTKSHLEALATECDTNASKFYFTGSTKNDAEVGLTMHSIGSSSERRLHVTFEYQNKRESPYPKFAQRKLTKIVRTLLEASTVTLRHAEFAFAPPSGTLPMFPEPPQVKSGRQLVLTGFQFELTKESEDEPEKGTRMKRDREGKGLTVTNWLRISRQVPTLEAGFALALAEATEQNGES